MRELPQLREPATRRETNSSAESGIDPGHLLSARDLDLFSSDQWQKVTADTIEIRKMVSMYRNKVLETPDDD